MIYLHLLTTNKYVKHSNCGHNYDHISDCTVVASLLGHGHHGDLPWLSWDVCWIWTLVQASSLNIWCNLGFPLRSVFLHLHPMGFFLWPPLAVQPFVSMSILLASCFNHLLGGTDADFCVMHVSGMMFHFTVSTKDVGFYIYRSCSFECQSFEVFFSLWGSGGPNWRKNYDLWIKEKDAEWMTVQRSKSTRKTYADVVQSRSVFKRSLSVSSHQFQNSNGEAWSRAWYTVLSLSFLWSFNCSVQISDSL